MTKDNHWCCICKKKDLWLQLCTTSTTVYDVYTTKICCNTSIAMKFLVVHG